MPHKSIATSAAGSSTSATYILQRATSCIGAGCTDKAHHCTVITLKTNTHLHIVLQSNSCFGYVSTQYASRVLYHGNVLAAQLPT